MVTPTSLQIQALLASGQFDAEWYRAANPDVDALKIDPALHYLIYGHRLGCDPGPNFSTTFARRAWRLKDVQEPVAWLRRAAKKSGSVPAPSRAKILSAASAVAQRGDHEQAISLAMQHIPSDLAYTVEILRANAASRQGDDTAWLRHMNAYLEHFGTAHAQLRPGREARFMRLTSSEVTPVTGGPLVSVIMPAWNAAATIEHAAESILRQSWKALELLIVDDRSDDDTWSVIQRIAARDSRVRPIRNKVNVGPYVSKNLALRYAKGAWITGHDADDWAMPTRIERHVRAAQDQGLKASVTDMLRVRSNGEVTHLSGITAFCFDGVARRASISCLFDAQTLRSRLGSWDSVRYGGDSEMIARAQALLGSDFGFVHDIGMICLNHPASLTNHAIHGVGEVGMSPSRVAYKEVWKDIYITGMDSALGYLPFPQQVRRHAAPKEMIVPFTDICVNLDMMPLSTPNAEGVEQNSTLVSAAVHPSEKETTPAFNHAGEIAMLPEPVQETGELPADPSEGDDPRLATFRFRRPDGNPFRILARGDCTSFRSVHLNKDLFPDGVAFIQAQKSPFLMLNEAADGMTVTRDVLADLSDVLRMPAVLQRHYLGQGDREILIEHDADLIIIDTWADMNFELWRSNKNGWTVWVHPKFLRDPAGFQTEYTSIGRRTLEQSLDDAERLIQILREKNPGIPVLVLNQQTDYYPKMDGRRDYYTFGSKLAKRLPNAWFGGVIARADLETADMDSCGPGNTLHFQSTTYRRMLENALREGMMDYYNHLSEKKFLHAAVEERWHTEKNQSRWDQLEAGEALTTPDQPAAISDESSVQAAQPENTLNQDNEAKACLACKDSESSVAPFADDNPDHVPYPVRPIALPLIALRSLEKYIPASPDSPPVRWTPVVIEVVPGGYADWERAINKRYSRVRMKRRSERAGHVVDFFNPRLHVPDMHEIHHSADIRSGGQIRGNYLKSVEEMGGAPNQYFDPVEPRDPNDWIQCFGVFKPLPGHRQGTVDVGRKLVSYVSVRRMGDILLYSQLMGHEAYLADGIMYHVHFHIVELVMNSGNPLYEGIKFVMYGGIGNGGPGLWQWKRTAGFTPMRLVAYSTKELAGTDAASAQ